MSVQQPQHGRAKRIWLSQIEQLPLPPYSPGVKVNPTHGNIGDKPLKFVVLMSTETPIAPGEGNSGAMRAYARLVDSYYLDKNNTASGKSSGVLEPPPPNLAALNEYERRLLKLKLEQGEKD